MITNKFSVFTKKQVKILKIVNFIQIIISVLLIVIAFISALPKWNGQFNYSYILALTTGIAGVISLVEIFYKKISNRKTLAFSLLLKIYKKKTPLFVPTQIQSEVCSWTNKNIQKEKSILLYGKVNTGKTTSIFIYLSQYIKNKEILKTLDWIENILYIDCKSNKNDILNFFDEENFFFKNQTYEKSLIIVDNIETMGEAFFKQLLELIRGSISTFILLADVNSSNSKNYNGLETKEIEEKFSIKIYKKHVDNFKYTYKILSYQEKIILLTVYYISMSITLIPVRSILAILDTDITQNQIYKKLKNLIRHNMIKKFPFDDNFVLLVNQKAIFESQGIFWETKENTDVIMKIIKNSNSFPESAWLSFIHLPYNDLVQMCQTKRNELFFNALKCSNYLTLIKALQDELVYSPNKESLFYYEMGTLLFFNSQQERAFVKYNTLIETTSDVNYRMTLMLKIIETTHGDTNDLTMKNIIDYLEQLNSKKEPYSLYSQYWRIHIDTERGIFNLTAYEKLLYDLVNLQIFEMQDIHLEIIKRCYTDIIRSYHILFRTPKKIILNDFLNFLEKYFGDTARKYYETLYINANYNHYICLLDKILNNENCESTYYQAITNYELAIKTGYQNVKSVSACELKEIDLKLYVPENLQNIDSFINKINKFLYNAEINKVSVHVAYCKTLLAKLCMIKNLTDEEYYIATEKRKEDKNMNIKKYLKDAKDIYYNFKNNYGIVRAEFLEFLYFIATCNESIIKDKAINKMVGILNQYPEYRREDKIIDSIKKKFDMCNRMFIISLIKAYPVIMQ